MTLSKIISAKGYLISHFAKQLGVTHATIINWNTNKKNITLKANSFFVEKLGKEYIQWLGK